MNDTPRNLEKTVTKVVVVVLVILVFSVFVSWFKRRGVPRVDPRTYQAVFIEGNQQYFGHLKGLGTRYPYLTDIYYMQTGGSGGQNFTIFKLGSEIHGPEDVMYLNWKKVLFWENLKSDSKVVEAIAQEKVQRGAE